MERIKMLEIAPLEVPRLIEVEHTLENLQELVGGTIQALYPWEDYCCILCDDNGKAKGYPANRVLEDEEGNPYDIIVGTFYICGLSRDDFASIPDDLAEKYTEKYRYPEMFMRTEKGHVMKERRSMKTGGTPSAKTGVKLRDEEVVHEEVLGLYPE